MFELIKNIFIAILPYIIGIRSLFEIASAIRDISAFYFFKVLVVGLTLAFITANLVTYVPIILELATSTLIFFEIAVSEEALILAAATLSFSLVAVIGTIIWIVSNIYKIIFYKEKNSTQKTLAKKISNHYILPTAILLAGTLTIAAIIFIPPISPIIIDLLSSIGIFIPQNVILMSISAISIGSAALFFPPAAKPFDGNSSPATDREDLPITVTPLTEEKVRQDGLTQKDSKEKQLDPSSKETKEKDSEGEKLLPSSRATEDSKGEQLDMSSRATI